MAKTTEYNGDFKEGPAAESIISLSQVLLAPLDSIFKAQIHAARSFLNMVLQMGYAHQPVKEDGTPEKVSETTNQPDQVYMSEFTLEMLDDKGQKELATIKIPALSLVPISPLSIDEADFQLEFKVSHVYRNKQMQESESEKMEEEKMKTKVYGREKRPWYLVSDPVSLRGVVAPKVSEKLMSSTSDSQESVIKINIKLGKQPMPAGLDKLLTTLTQSGQMTKVKK
jgi:hypothetical protein